MAALQLACPSCKTILQVAEENRGKAVRCPKCQTILKIPAAGPPAAASKAPASAKPPPAPLSPASPPRPPAPKAAFAPKPIAPPAPVMRAAAIRPTPAEQPAAKGGGLPLLPALALGALLIFLAGCGTVTSLFLFAKMMGPGKPTSVADADNNPDPARTAPTDPNGGKPDGNTPQPLTEDQKFAATYLADDFTGLVFLRPKRVLASESAASLPQEEWFGALAAISLDPRDAEEAVVVLDPTPNGDAPVSVGGVARFAEKLNVRLLKMSLPGGAKENTYQDKKYYTPAAPAQGTPLAVYFADDHTIAAGPEPTLKKMLSAKGTSRGGATPPLLDRLQKADLSDDVTAIVAVEPMRSLVAAAVKQVPAGPDAPPPPLRDGLALADQVNAIALTANLTKDPLLTVDLEAKDARTALAALKVVESTRAYLQDHYGDIKNGFLSEAPADAKALFDRFSGELNRNLTAKTESSHVRISANRPASTKDLIAKLGPIAPQLFATRPITEPPPPPIPKDVRELGVEWVRNNNALGPTHKIVEDVDKRLNDQVGFDQGFVATLGARLVKSQKPTMLVGWNSEVFPLELTPEQAKQANIQDAVVGVMAVPSADDFGPGLPVAKLSGLQVAHADALDAAARMTGTVGFHRMRPDAADEYYTVRLSILAPRTRITVFQHLGANPLPKDDGPLVLDFPPLNDRKLGLNGPVPVLVEIIAYLDADRQGKPFVVSSAAAELVVPSATGDGDKPPPAPPGK